MITKIMSIGLKGLEGYCVQVEVQAVDMGEGFTIVGLPDASIKESKERVKATLYSQGCPLIGKRIVVNLSPSEQKKNGPLFDLPIAIGILKSLRMIGESIPNSTGFIGALSLDGSILPFEGMLAAALAAKKIGFNRLYMPFNPDLPEIIINEVEIIFVSSLRDVLQHLSGKTVPELYLAKKLTEEIYYEKDFQQIIGHSVAKRALEIAAAGEHHVFMIGPPGCGKSMLAEAFPSILPPLSYEEKLEKISLYQLAGMDYEVIHQPPFRAPHHSASTISIIGGGQHPKPGEISLAHRGVLFLDEMAEFSKKTLDMLRQPIETGKITISRVRSIVTYPSSFLLIGAMNPCPCGYLGSESYYCTCTRRQIQSYKNRISGPIRDRFDISLILQRVNLVNSDELQKESSAEIRQRVDKARDFQYKRYGYEMCNGKATYELLLNKGGFQDNVISLLQKTAMQQNWSNRVQLKILRLARTISDLDGEVYVTDDALREAMLLCGEQKSV
ncbi:YifB family Mg chelatase-like AAA ATPase [Metabacillus schmidteae]|uniref:YifB family Mg chelatase-like AAA ATPase n=1 Tax=Metabacillus schmidteae TaxID=2730405 RepID=UPI00158CEEEC|nr:YifB family Mg chelatase-like AAA ATPase [Metabacillus schmidteae]